MGTLLLAIIYLAFISLGLPDSLLGSAWPLLHAELNMPISAAGIVTMLISVFTIISSVFSDKIIRRFGTGRVVAASVLLTVMGLLGFSFSRTFLMLCVMTLPYGLGAGAIDASLNNYVALHYSSRDMSWLHCFWGVGTVISPYVMSFALTKNMGWQAGYRIVAYIQIAILVVLVCALPLWKKVELLRAEKALPNNTEKSENETPKSEKEALFDGERARAKGISEVLKIKGAVLVFLGFFAYCAAESTVMLWASTFFYEARATGEELAAALGSIFFIGMTLGRFISGFVSNRVGDKNMIRLGYGISILGMLLVGISKNLTLSIIGFVLIGLGFAPIYPSIIHATPENFGEGNSQSVIGLQMAFAYLGSTLMPPLFGLIANHIDVALMPLYLLILAVVSIVMLELLNKQKSEKYK